jgi:DNA-binding response OmpR family regulator
MPPMILIVEDEAYLAQLLSDVLRSAGYGVVLSTGGQAVALAVERPPAAIVLDYVMPGLHGGKIANQIRDAIVDATPPIILVTGLQNARELAREVGAEAYLRKPFDVAKLVQVVDSLVGPAAG